jgi:hypothetical protein
MKRILLLIVFIVLSCNESFSQSKNRLGLVFGLNHFSVRGSSFIDAVEADTGHLIGLTYEYKFNKKFSLVTGITLEQKNLEYNDAYTLGFFDDDWFYTVYDYTISTANRYEYLTIPLLIRYNFGNRNSFFVNGGLFAAYPFKLEHRERTTITNVTLDYSYNTETIDSNNFLFSEILYSDLDYGLTFGFGKIFYFGSKYNLLIELRNNLGLDNLIDDSGINGVTGIIKTNTVNLLFQLSIDL